MQRDLPLQVLASDHCDGGYSEASASCVALVERPSRGPVDSEVVAEVLSLASGSPNDVGSFVWDYLDTLNFLDLLI